MRITLIMLFIFTFSIFAQKVLIIFPSLGQSRSEKLLSMMNQISMRLKSEYDLNAVLKQPEEFPKPEENEKILSIAEEEGADQVVYINIDLLGNKVFYNVVKYKCSNQTVLFSDNFTVMKVEDFEVIIGRFAKMIGEGQLWAETITIDEVTARDAQKRKQRSHGHFGIFLSAGIDKPFGESLTRQENSYSYYYYDNEDRTIQPSQFLVLSGGFTYDIRKFYVDADFTLLGYSGMALNLGGGYYIKDDFIAPYAGATVSAAWVFNTVPSDTSVHTYDRGYYDYNTSSYIDSTVYDTSYNYSSDVGFGITGRLGVKFLRDHFFQPFVEFNGTAIFATRIETFAGARFGIAMVF
jgi:hypothetical protein